MTTGKPPRFRTEVLLDGNRSEETGSRRTVIGVSIGLHVVLLAVVLLMPAPKPRPREPEPVDVVFFSPRPAPAPVTPPRPKIEPPKAERPKAAPEREIVPQVAVASPEPDRAAPPPVKTARVDPPPRTPPEPEAVAPKPAAPRPEVRTDVFGGESVAQARKAPKKKVRTDASAGHRASARVGGFEVEPSRPQTLEERRAVTPSSFENPASPAPREDSTRGRATVELASFGDAVHEERETGEAKGAAVVRQGGFGDGVAEAQPRKKRSRPTTNPDTPVEILSKPAPVYTEEARQRRVEGEVVLKVVFISSGELKILDVVSRLGHGLDEAAIEAARKIRFKPARRDGRPVDYTAVLRIVFQLV